MEALFVIPTLVSPNINEKLVPALCKLVERNIAIENQSLIRAALTRKYLNSKSVYRESSLPDEIGEFSLLEGRANEPNYNNSNKNDTNKKRKDEDEDEDILSSVVSAGSWVGKKSAEGIKKALSRKEDENAHNIGVSELKLKNSQFTDVEKVEIPMGITFFNQISLEPTIIEIPLVTPVRQIGGFKGTTERLTRVGFKCVPYTVKHIEDIVYLINNSSKMNFIMKYVKKKAYSIATKVPFSKPRAIRKGKSNIYSRISKDPIENIIYAPTLKDLSNPRRLSRMMQGGGNPSNWSSMIILSSFDISDKDFRELIFNYDLLAKYIFGDIMVVNETKEEIYICTPRTRSCSGIGLSYLKQILNLGNVIDYNEISNYSKPFHKVSINNVVKESTTEQKLKKLLEGYFGNE